MESKGKYSIFGKGIRIASKFQRMKLVSFLFISILLSMLICPPFVISIQPEGCGFPSSAIGQVASNAGGLESKFTSWIMNSATGKSWTDNVGEADWWYTDLRNIDWKCNDALITKIDYQPENGGSSHTGYYAITGGLGQTYDGYSILLFPEATLRPIPAPQIIEVRDEAGEADFSWEAAQSAGDINLIAGYLFYSFQTTDESYQPTDNDNWILAYPDPITGTALTMAGLDPAYTYFFSLRIVYPDGFSTTHISGNSAAVKVTPPAFDPFSYEPPAEDPPPANDPPPADPEETPEISGSDLGGVILPGAAGCGANGQLGFGFLPLFGMFFLRRKNRS
jgi:hypothetical protein